MSEILNKLSGQGVSIWLDDISRERLRTGNLDDLIRDKNVVGVTSNPTIFAGALSKGDAYDTQMHDLAVRGVDVGEAVRAITTYDIRWAADVLRPVYDATSGVDGRVSIEVDPRLARDDRQDDRRGPRAVVAGRPAQPVHQDPGDRRGPARDHAGDRRGHQRQRHADLLAGALPRGHGRLAGRAGGGAGQGAQPGHDRVGRVVLRQPRRHRDRQAPGQDRRQGRAEGQGGRRQRAPGLRRRTRRS